MKRTLRTLYTLAVYCLAGIGLIFVAVFVALRLQWTDLPGGIDERTADFSALTQFSERSPAVALTALEQTTADTTWSIEKIDDQIAETIQYQTQLLEVKQDKQRLLCQIRVLSSYAGYDAAGVWTVYQQTQSQQLWQKMEFALKPYLPTEYEPAALACSTATDLTDTESSLATLIDANKTVDASLFAWRQAEEWPILVEALSKDTAIIQQAAEASGVPARLIMSALIVEQLRLYHTQREYYEQYFEPLKILASATKFAWGVMSIKEGTAIQIEQHLTDVTSPYYLGEDKANLLAFTTNDYSSERYNRLTSESDHYYSYLYGGLYLNQLITQWRQAGYDISERPEIITTLFNIGFNNSQPKADPQVGGSTISINGHHYTFGGLGYELYYSGEFLTDFPLTK